MVLKSENFLIGLSVPNVANFAGQAKSKVKCAYYTQASLLPKQQKQAMHDSLKKINATLESTPESSKLLSGKDPMKSIQAKGPKNEALNQTDPNFAPRQAGRDWWWCDDV